MKGSLLVNGITIAASFTVAAVVVLPYSKIVVELQETVDEHKTSIAKLKTDDVNQDATLSFLVEQTDLLEKKVIDYKKIVDASMTVERVSRRVDELPDLSCISKLSSSEDLIFDGCNVHIRNGESGTVANGVGNLIVGYDLKEKVGSHNLVVGSNHEYTSHSGLVAGSNNKISAPFATVTGGAGNEATVEYSSVSGGEFNVASGKWSSVTGGYMNTASEKRSAVSGGWQNVASETFSSISGGGSNTASGIAASVSGGKDNTASGKFSSVLGGLAKTASETFSTAWNNEDDEDKRDFSIKVGV